MIKEDFRFEDYLQFIGCRNLRVALSRIRLSSHNFMIERGRWKIPKLDPSERCCEYCQNNTVLEDEYHCLVECPRFKCFQRKYLPEYLLRRPSMFMFTKFMKADCLETMFNLAKLCLCVLKSYTL